MPLPVPALSAVTRSMAMRAVGQDSVRLGGQWKRTIINEGLSSYDTEALPRHCAFP